jgi:hypothetical protein
MPRIINNDIIDPWLARLYRIIEAERADQDAQWGGPEHDDALTPEQWLLVLSRHVGLGAMDAGRIDPVIWRRQIKRVCATALAAMEADARKHPAEYGMVMPPPYQKGSGV